MIKDIISMEGDYNNPILTITTAVKESKKSFVVNFLNSYEKYIFKSIVYNYIVKPS